MDIYALILLSMLAFTGVLCYGIYLIMKDIDDLERVININMRRLIDDRDASDSHCERISPELKESDDERMFREIKRYIKGQGDKPTGLPNGTAAVADMIAWLEKQGKKGGEK